MKKQSFLTGAVILMIANAISKILGAVFKIPLTYILNEDGMAVFNIAFEVYIMFLSFIISGLPFAISKMVAESNSRGEYSKTHRIVKISTILLVCISGHSGADPAGDVLPGLAGIAGATGPAGRAGNPGRMTGGKTRRHSMPVRMARPFC